MEIQAASFFRFSAMIWLVDLICWWQMLIIALIQWMLHNPFEDSRAVASMYSWGGVGQKFPNDEKNFRIFHVAYEATKVFAIRKMKMQFTNKNTHSLRKDILQKHAVP